MDTNHSRSSTSSSEASKQESFLQESTNSHDNPSQSSQTYTNAPSGTGHGASAINTTTVDLEPSAHDAALDNQYSSVSSPDQQQDLSHVGSLATTIGPVDDILGNDSLLSPNSQTGTAFNDVHAEDRSSSPMAEDEGTKEEAVELLRASLHRKM